MTLPERPHARYRTRASRAVSGIVVAVGLLLVSACGLNVQTLQPYTPAEGVNADVGASPVHVRNLMILSREAGSGFLSASLSTADRDTLTSVTGKAYKPDGTAGSTLTATLTDPVAFGNNAPVVLTNRSLIEVAGADLAPGLDAELTLVFSSAGSITLKVPVVDADQQAYATITPTPSPAS